MLPQSWTPLRYHPDQAAALRSTARFVALAAGRGSGKTEISRRRVVMALAQRKPWPDPMYFYALPTVAQAKRVAWKPLKALVPAKWVKAINESAMTIETVFGSTLYVLGLDKPERAEGVQWDGGIVDESCDQRPGHFDRTLLPAMSHRTAWCWRIGVPKRFGKGAAEFKEFWLKGQDASRPEYASWSWPSYDILPPEEIELHRNALDERDFNEQYGASWESASGAIFYAFSEFENVDANVIYDPNRPIIIGSDFNVDPMSWVIGHRTAERLEIFDEIFARNTNTQLTLDLLAEKYGSHTAGFEFYGDASGRARKTSASSSDYILIKNDDRFKKKRVFYPRSNPAVSNRFAATNALLLNAKKQRRCFINPRCKHLIKDLNQRAYKKGSREPDDSGDIGHMTDAFGYIIYSRWPVRIVQETMPEVSVSVQ